MENILLLTALWLGILTSISPCPLATNIAAVSFVSYRINHKGIVLLSGILYMIGRSITYTVIGFLTVEAFINIPVLSDFLLRYINKMLGILLIVVGMFLLGLLPINLPTLSVSGKAIKKIEAGILGSLLLGVLFALAFCPISAAIFFGSLIPLTIKAKSSITLPLFYGIGTGLIVLIFAVLVAVGSECISKVYQGVTQLEYYTKRATGVIFILVGIYHIVSHVFGIRIF